MSLFFDFSNNCDLLSKEIAELIKASSQESKLNETDPDLFKPSEYKLKYNKEEATIYDYIDIYRANYTPSVMITPLSVSVQSAKAKMTMVFDLHILAGLISKSIIYNINNKNNIDFPIIGVFYKEVHEGNIKKPRPRKKGAFPNNMAIIIRSPMGTGKNIHMKIFTGDEISSISMVGCKIKEDGLAVCKILEQYILKETELFTTKDFKVNDFETTMVNSNYSIGFKVDRDRLFHHLSKNYKELFVSYDPVVYAAVKIGYYFNLNKHIQNGLCECNGNPCTLIKSTSGKGTGDGIGQCKKVTIAIFESGNIVITGGRTINHANSAYSFINIIITNDAKYFASINLNDMCEKNV